MAGNGAKIFSLAEANDAVRALLSLTAAVIRELDLVREAMLALGTEYDAQLLSLLTAPSA